MKLQLSELQKTAVHEAGHAVLYYVFGRQLDYIGANETGDGYTKPYYSYLPTAFATASSIGLEEKILEYGIICFGGYFSEFKVQKKQLDLFKIGDIYRKSQNEYATNDFGDIREQMEIANNIVGKDLFDSEFFQMIAKRTKTLIDKKEIWNAIISLSNALIHSKNGNLNGDQIHDLLNEFDLVGKYKVDCSGVYINKDKYSEISA